MQNEWKTYILHTFFLSIKGPLRIYHAAPQNFVALMGDVSPQGGNVMESLIAKIKVMKVRTYVVSKQKNQLLSTFKLKFFFCNTCGCAQFSNFFCLQLKELADQKNGHVNRNLVNVFLMLGFVMIMRTVMISQTKKFAVSITNKSHLDLLWFIEYLVFWLNSCTKKIWAFKQNDFYNWIHQNNSMRNC